MNILRYFLTSMMCLFYVISLLYGVQLGYSREKNIDFTFSITYSGFANSAIFCSLVFIIFEILCSSLNVELYNNMHLKIKR